MSAKKNATSALKELGKMVGIEAAEEDTVSTAYDNNTAVPNDMKPSYAATLRMSEMALKKTHTIIDTGTTITGNITVDGNLTCNGTIIGDIACNGDFVCRGKVDGSIFAENVNLVFANISGDINANADVNVDDGTTVIGNVKAANILLDGKLKGNLYISGLTKLEAHGILVGDISTERLSISDGSRFSGALNMTDSIDLAKIFE